jgi:hypothetical protein
MPAGMRAHRCQGRTNDRDDAMGSLLKGSRIRFSLPDEAVRERVAPQRYRVA